MTDDTHDEIEEFALPNGQVQIGANEIEVDDVVVASAFGAGTVIKAKAIEREGKPSCEYQLLLRRDDGTAVSGVVNVRDLLTIQQRPEA